MAGLGCCGGARTACSRVSTIGNSRIAALFLAAASAAGLAIGASGCAAARRAPGAGAPAALPARPPAQLPPRATLHFERLGALPDLPEPTELVDRKVPPDALKHYLAGLALATNYEDANAIPEFEAAIAADRAAFEPRLALGRAALRAGDLAKAQSALEAAAKQRPRSPDIHYLLGVVAAARDDGPTALRQLRYALALAENDGQRILACFHLSQVLERQDYYQAAIEIANRFEALARRNVTGMPMGPQWRDLVASQGWRILSLRAACLRRLGRLSEAVDAYDAALKAAPGNTEVMLDLAETLIDVGNIRRAAEVADRILTSQPGHPGALAVLAATLAVDNRQAELRERLLGIVRENPADIGLAQRVASVFLKFGQLDSALQTLLIARKGVSDPTPIYAALMQIVLANDDLSRAVDSLASVLAQMELAEQDRLLEPGDRFPVNPSLARQTAARGDAVLSGLGSDGPKLFALGIVAGAAGQPALAERALRAAFAAQPDARLIAIALGEQLLAQCRWEDAIAFIEPLVDRFNESGPLHRILGAAYDGLDDYASAMSSLEKALRYDRRDPKAIELVASINDRLGRPQQAAAYYQALVSIRPDAWAAHVALIKNLIALRQKDVAVQQAKRLKESCPQSAAADLCLLMAQANDAIPPAKHIAALLKLHPDDPMLLQALGEAELAEGNPGQATVVLTGVLAGDPGNEDVRLLLTTSLARHLKLDLAMQVLQSLLADHPNRVLWRFAQAELFAQMGRPEAAAEVMFDLLKTGWGQEQKHTLYGRLVFFLEYAGRHQQAIDLLQQELKASPDDRATQTLLLGVLENQNRRGEAVELLRLWRAKQPEDPLLRRLEVQFLRAMGADEAAEAEVLKDWPTGKGASGNDVPSEHRERLRTRDLDLSLMASVLAPPQAADWLASRAWLGPSDLTASSLAAAAADEGRYLEAIELDRLAPPGDEALARRTQWTFLAGDRAHAELVLLPQVQARNVDLHTRLRRMLSTFYKRMGLSELALRQAEAMYEQYKEGDRAVEYANDLAYSYAERSQNLAIAQQLARRAVAGDANNAAYMDTLAWVYYKLGRFQDAMRWIDLAVRVPGQAEDPVLRDHLGDVLWRLGRRDEAAANWRKAAVLYVEELKTDRYRTDLRQGLESVTGKIKAVESRKPPAVAPWAGQKKRTPS
jgi:tetratricopeptide (TPR) repeat protein